MTVKRALLPIAVLIALLACSGTAQARGGAGHNPATKKLEDAFKIALYVRSVSTDGCYPPAKQLARKIGQTKRGLTVGVANGPGSVNRLNVVFVLKHGSNCNKVLMALRASSGLYVLNSAQGTIRVQGSAGGNQMLLTEEMYAADGVRELLGASGYAVDSGPVALRGIEQPLTIYTVTMAAAALV